MSENYFSDFPERWKQLKQYSSLSDLANLIFHSGLSTAEKISDLSGRGVGMDAVKQFLQQKGGAIQVQLHQNTNLSRVPFTFQFSIPAKYAIQLDLYAGFEKANS